MFSGVSRSLTAAATRQDVFSGDKGFVERSRIKTPLNIKADGNTHPICERAQEAEHAISSGENNSEKLIIDFTMDEC